MVNEDFRKIINCDVNLLVSLYFLLRERQVSAAAKYLFIGQPAMSHQLARLREIFNDRLLIRTSDKMMMTPFAERIFPLLEKLLIDMNGFMSVSGNLNTSSPHKNKYKICVTDDIYIKNATVALYEYVKGLGLEDAVAFEVTGRYPYCTEDLNNGIIDLFFGNCEKISENVLSQPFREDCWCWAVSAKHPLAGKHITPYEIDGAMYVDFVFLKKAKYITHNKFGKIMDTMKCVLETSSFNAAINFIQNSEALCMLPEHIINKYNLSVITLDNERSTKISSYVYWHRSVDGDPFLQWLRNDLVKEYVELL
ncbi:LysR family transcriptional regulator [Yersinia ruckeri]|uniref:LysR family transcriptional regulator n=1 Tax=Yersinia ruckeri TaxID=29486 RepID=UPI0008FE193B|nr:LysR family transcriptional regulator [Yersinia ruckeri]OJB83277.1 hypothetical protein A9Q62_03930 [Yersinia ruckeri]OJB89157.1 hypothetical protein A9Q60_03970 [Yersinia ruckeri]OJB92084.1 hypothetical protein AXW59_04095 [Yersinia ruckeri]OJB95257.1 hypothetical protein AXW58_04105 [Yersinia ruckeri]OJB98874.1 hypothetical protein AXW57_04095 [Yersinia ruckeri]